MVFSELFLMIWNFGGTFVELSWNFQILIINVLNIKCGKCLELWWNFGGTFKGNFKGLSVGVLGGWVYSSPFKSIQVHSSPFEVLNLSNAEYSPKIKIHIPKK
jgi:hypothetical protein